MLFYHQKRLTILYTSEMFLYLFPENLGIVLLYKYMQELAILSNHKIEPKMLIILMTLLY